MSGSPAATAVFSGRTMTRASGAGFNGFIDSWIAGLYPRLSLDRAVARYRFKMGTDQRTAGARPRLAAAVLAATLVALSAAAVSGQARTVHANQVPANPSANISEPRLLASSGECTEGRGGLRCASPCDPHGKFGFNTSKGCDAVALSGINRGRKAEGLSPMVLPNNYRRLTTTQQLFVLVNLERVARGVPPLVGLTPVLSADAGLAAKQSRDPDADSAYGTLQVAVVNGSYGEGGTWDGDSPNPIAAMFGWIYDDGWGGPKHTSNYDCTSAGASGCWGHRDELLGEYSGPSCTTCVAGAGFATRTHAGALTSYAFLLVAPANGEPPLSFSWSTDVLPHLPPSEQGLG
jgi:hypothetical protein